MLGWMIQKQLDFLAVFHVGHRKLYCSFDTHLAGIQNFKLSDNTIQFQRNFLAPFNQYTFNFGVDSDCGVGAVENLDIVRMIYFLEVKLSRLVILNLPSFVL